MFNKEIIERFGKLKTPFYYYDLDLLEKTVKSAKKESDKYGFHLHYALKANCNERVLQVIQSLGLGADCVSGNEIKRAVESGFASSTIAFAGVGKSDDEINYALSQNIFSFNCESIQELQVINELAAKQKKQANIALRLNPNVDAYTHKYITTGLEENKFGINAHEIDTVLELLKTLPNLNLTGLHFHIGSQITDLEAFKKLCVRVNEFVHLFEQKGIHFNHINVGGGLGINYQEPDLQSIPDFASYFALFNELLESRIKQKTHFELGRALVANCGSLISRVLYIKKGVNINFIIVDAGMTELIRPALYQAYHKIENLTSANLASTTRYDVVGPICESSDCFGKAIHLPESKRGDIIAIRSTGAYGEVMASTYNLRDKAITIFDK